MLKSMILFPKIFSHSPDKFNSLAVWLVNSEGIVCPNIRDVFTAGGQGTIEWNKKSYNGIPKIIIRLTNSVNELKTILNETSIDVLEKHWNTSIKCKVESWIEQIEGHSPKLKSFDLVEYLKDQFADTQS